jgi:hypothetical protein
MLQRWASTPVAACSSASLAAATLLSAAMNCYADASWHRVSTAGKISLCSAAAFSASASVGRSAKNSSSLESSSLSLCGGAGSYGGGSGSGGRGCGGGGGAPVPLRGSMA